MTGEISRANAEALGTDFYEVTAHQGARPDHALWQGRVYKMHGSTPEYPNLIDATGYGTGEGLMGWNCRHGMFPFIPGISTRAYTDEELDEIDPPPFVYEGKPYTAYDATQMQRKLETAMRKTKRELDSYDAADLKDDFTAASIRLRRQKEYYKDFSSKAGLPLQNERIQVLGYGKSISSKAVWAEKKAFTSAAKNGIIIKSRQFGKKVGKHATDFGFDPADPNARNKVREIIGDIVAGSTEKRIGFWRGQPNEVVFHIKGENVVITKQSGEFVTVMKGGINNDRVKNARKL